MKTTTKAAFRIRIQCRAENSAKEESWCMQLRQALGVADPQAAIETEILPGSTLDATGVIPDILFVDGEWEGAVTFLSGPGQKGRALFAILPVSVDRSELVDSGWVDDVIVAPLRPMEVRSRVAHYRQLLMWDEITQLNQNLGGIIEELKQDLALAERLQKARLPLRFDDIKGIKINHRYIAGLRSGGDHFDIAESTDRQWLSMVMTDSSTYGLSSSVLAVLMKVAVRLGAASGIEYRSASTFVTAFQDELQSTLRPEKDKLSLFYGVLSRRDLRFRFASLGGCRAFVMHPGGSFEVLEAQAGALTSSSEKLWITERTVTLQPGSRIVLCSDGFDEVLGLGREGAKLLDSWRERDGKDFCNELAYRVKQSLPTYDEMPAQDATALVIEIDPRAMRLAQLG